LKRRAVRRQRRSEMVKRKTVAQQERMKIITQLSKTDKNEKKDTFGMKDEDWDVYKSIQKVFNYKEQSKRKISTVLQ